MTAREVNFDGLPGLTHHYAGLSFGNEASTGIAIGCLTRSWRPSRG